MGPGEKRVTSTTPEGTISLSRTSRGPGGQALGFALLSFASRLNMLAGILREGSSTHAHLAMLADGPEPTTGLGTLLRRARMDIRRSPLRRKCEGGRPPAG